MTPKNEYRRLIYLSFMAAILAVTRSSAAQTTIHSYKYQFQTGVASPPRFVSELQNPGNASGQYYQVETDALGRIIRHTRIRDGKNLFETRWHYSGDTSKVSGYDTLVNGDKNASIVVKRNDQGGVVRIDQTTTEGALTRYALTTCTPSQDEVVIYSPDNKQVAHQIWFYSSKGLRNRQRDFSPGNENTYVDTEYDDDTGLEKSIRQFSNGMLDDYQTISYDGNGDKTRVDLYDSKKNWYGYERFADNIKTNVTYKFSDGSSEELRHTYDHKRFLEETQVFVNDKLICRLSYERFPNGAIKRTLAKGPDGALWAEYPNIEVWEPQRDGHPPQSSIGIFYKQGNWW